ncbi:MAG: 2-oxoglutarate dehydrogenase complex dihydrolipoyllysine-residue succinyltransferase [Parachlamydiaceae bacterium]|nr:2-oxoglutarate dehydrogenase complex dihydrolipoyllysine-residue succinyltransferase [Parachlamydiaceae bacterium]
MKVEIKVPAMGESISEASVGTILKPAGSSVAMDNELLELETDKVNQVLYAQQAGIVSYVVASGDTVKIGQVIGHIDTEGKATQEAAKATPKPEKPMEPKKEEESKAQKKPVAPPEASKSEARISKEAFVAELTQEKKAPTQPVSAPVTPAVMPKATGIEVRQETRKKMSRIRQVIAKRLVESQQTMAMLTTFNEVDMSQVMSKRELYKESFAKQYGVRLGFMSFFVKAVVEALKAYPNFNCYIDGDDLVQREYYDIGIAVGTDRGLVVPVVRGCDKLSFAEIEGAIEKYAKKAREGGLAVDDLQGGGFTITNGGVYGSMLSTPIINPPQCGILGMHKITKRAMVVDDQIVIRPMMYLALSYDHRIVDGKEAVSFLVTVKDCLEDPARLVLHI